LEDEGVARIGALKVNKNLEVERAKLGWMPEDRMKMTLK
jgi:hypothetical protein